eukprot:52830-Amphidinium_carterae.1
MKPSQSSSLTCAKLRCQAQQAACGLNTKLGCADISPASSGPNILPTRTTGIVGGSRIPRKRKKDAVQYLLLTPGTELWPCAFGSRVTAWEEGPSTHPHAG